MPSRWSARRAAMRVVLEGEQCVHPGSVYDPISLRIAQDVGFEVGMLAGSVASMAVLGAPDHIVLTLSEFADLALRINRGGDLPLMVDADHGYGNALNVMRTVEELENAGISGMSIEDTDLPRPFDANNRPKLLSIEEGVGKMQAGLTARRDASLVIAGRTSVSGAVDFDDVIKRVKAYSATGVDAIFVVGAKTKGQLEALHAATSLPLILGGVPAALNDKATLAQYGARISLQGHQPFAAGVNAVYETLKSLRDGTPPAQLRGVATGEMMKRVTHDEQYAGWINQFLDDNN